MFPSAPVPFGKHGGVSTCCFHGALKLFELCASTPLQKAPPMEKHPNPEGTAAGKQGHPARVAVEQKKPGLDA